MMYSLQPALLLAGSLLACTAPDATDAIAESSTGTLLLGTDTVYTSAVSVPAGSVNAFPFVAAASGAVGTLQVFVDSGNSARTVKLGIYSQANSAPASLLDACTVASVTANAWNACSASGASLTAGRTYYAAILSPAGGNPLRYRIGGSAAPAHWMANQATLPATYASGGTWSSAAISFAAVAAPVARLECAPGYSHELFRDDFDGTTLDTTKWSVVKGAASPSGGENAQLTNYLAANVSVANGLLHVALERHCANPWTNPGTPAHPASCAGTNYYSGGWIKGRTYGAAAHGYMAFYARIPTPAVPGYWPALWARNTQAWGAARYGELDLIEQWYDLAHKGTPSSTDAWSAGVLASWAGSRAYISTNNAVSVTGMSGGFRVFEVEWDATPTDPAQTTVRYYYRPTLGGARTLLRTITYANVNNPTGLTASAFDAAIADAGGWVPYIDNKVQPDTVWHVGPDAAPTFDPPDLLVDSVVMCAP